MQRINRPVFAPIAVFCLSAVVSLPAHAQSGSRTGPTNASQAPVALEGYCSVSLVKMNTWVKGVPSIQAVFDGHTYLFANEQGQKMFLADPKAYANADLADGGNCAVCRVEMKMKVPGKPEFTVFHDGLRYQFPNAKMRDMFLANPKKYQVAATSSSSSLPGSGTR